MDSGKITITAEHLYSEWIEACTLTSLHQAASAETKQLLGLELLEYCGAVISVARNLPDCAALNCCLSAHHVDTHLSYPELSMLFQSRGIRRYNLHQNMFVESPSDDKLKESHLVTVQSCVKLERTLTNLEPLVQTGNIVKVGHNQAWDFALMLCHAMGLYSKVAALFSQLPLRPEWHVFMSYNGYLPDAVAALFTKGNTAWLTVTANSGQSDKSLTELVSRCLHQARQLGCTMVYSKSDQGSVTTQSLITDVLLNLGFNGAYTRETYAQAGLFSSEHGQSHRPGLVRESNPDI